MIEADFFDESQQRLEIFVCLTGKTYNDRSAQRCFGNYGPDILKKPDEIIPATMPSHPFQHGIAGMLNRYVKIRADMRMIRHRLYHRFSDTFRMTIQKTNPEIARQPIQPLQKLRQFHRTMQIIAVGRGIL